MNRDLTAITNYFGGLWDASVRSGKISVKAATEQERESTTLITSILPSGQASTAGEHALNVQESTALEAESDMTIDNDQAYSVDQWNYIVDGNVELFYGTSGNTPLYLEKVCPCCFGACAWRRLVRI